MGFEAIVCKFKDCKFIYENPVTLPCGSSLCSIHLNQFNQRFVCQFCRYEHEIPQSGFPISKSISETIQNYFNLNSMRTKIKKEFNRLTESIQHFESIDHE